VNYIYGLLMSWGMFTVIPCPYRGWKEEARGHMLVCFPIIGAVIGAIWYGIFAVSGYLPIYLRTVLVAIIPWFFTGFMHLDGYMDVCDAVMSRRDLETRQKILKDSRVGAFAVICIGILMLTQAGSVLSMLELENPCIGPGLIFIPIASRICASLAVINFKPMNTSQYTDLKKKVQFNVALVCMLIILLVVILYFMPGSVISVLTTMAVYWVCALYGKKMLGGMNGDISGYALTLAELAGIIGLIL